MALPDKLQVQLLAPTSMPFDEEVDSVKLTTELGEMVLLPGHIPLVGVIDFSLVTLVNEAHVEEYYVRNGSVSIDEDGETVRILGHDVQLKSEMDIRNIEEYMNFISRKLKNKEDLSRYQIEFLEGQKSSLEKSFAVLKKG